MAYYPQNATGLNYVTYPAGPVTDGLAVTADSTANTKGAYTEAVSSAPFTANAMHVMVQTTTTNAGRLFLVDVAVGAAGAESVIVPDLMCEGTSGVISASGHGLYPMIPVAVASGGRLSLRCQSSTGSTVLTQIAVTLVAAGGVSGITSLVNYGASSADSGGTAVDPGGTADTKGAYSELTSSSSAVAQWLGMMVMFGHTNVNTASWAIDLATGAGGSETVLIPDVRFSAATDAGARPNIQPRMYPFLTYVSSGTRIAARASCSLNDNPDRIVDVALLAGTAPSESGGGSGGEVAHVFIG